MTTWLGLEDAGKVADRVAKGECGGLVGEGKLPIGYG